MIADNPMDIQEEMLEVIRSYSSDNPIYQDSTPFMSEWTKRAYLVACSILIPEERRFFLKNANTSLLTDAILEKSIINWALK